MEIVKFTVSRRAGLLKLFQHAALLMEVSTRRESKLNRFSFNLSVLIFKMKRSAKTFRRSFKQQADNKRRPKATKAPKIMYKAVIVEDGGSPQTCITTDPIIDRIEKCLRRAKHVTTPKLEAEAAFNHASRLMQQHNILKLKSVAPTARQECAGQSVVSLRPADGFQKRVVNQTFARIIAKAVERFFDCKSYATKKRTSMEWTFCGIAENAAAAAMAFEVAYNRTCEQARLKNGIASRNSYCLGVGIELLCMAEAETEAQERGSWRAESQIEAESGWQDPIMTAYDDESTSRPVQRYDLRSRGQHGLQPDIKHVCGLNMPQLPRQTSTQIVAFRKCASAIADEYLRQHGVRLLWSRVKPGTIKDHLAYKQGTRDGRKIGVRYGMAGSGYATVI